MWREMLFDEPTETHTILNYVLVWGATPYVIPPITAVGLTIELEKSTR